MLIWLKSKGVPLYILLAFIVFDMTVGVFLVKYELQFFKWYWEWVTGTGD